MSFKSTISSISLLLIPLVLIAIGLVTWFAPQSTPVESDDFFQEASWLGPGGHEMIANLVNAKIVTPNRPHDPIEARDPEQLSQVSRRRVFEVSTNSLGLRGSELEPKSNYRILCLGESVTFGWGVKNAETYPSQLQKRLGVEVINAGIPAMKPSHMAKWLQRHGPTIGADLVLFTVRPNWMAPDPWEDFFRSIRNAKRAAHPAPVAVILPPISTFDLRGNQQRPEELRQLKQRLSDIPWLDLTPAFRAALPKSGVTLSTQGATQQMVDRQSDTVLVKATTQKSGSLAPEIVSALEDNHDLKEPLMFDGAHPDAEGFVVFAEAVAEFINAQSWR